MTPDLFPPVKEFKSAMPRDLMIAWNSIGLCTLSESRVAIRGPHLSMLSPPERLPQRDLLGLFAGRLAVTVQSGLQFGDGKFVCNCRRFYQDSDPRGRTYAAERETAPSEFGNAEDSRFIERGSGDRNGVRHIGAVRK